MTEGGRDRAIAEIAAKQRTMVAAAQLYARGVTKRAIEWRVRAGVLHPEFRGVYSFG